jgi:predicted AlkP superfamily phosphohydrolase/phosphomutase
VATERRSRTWFTALLAAALVASFANPAQAYIGPGAGFALLSSFLVVFTTIILAVLSVLLWPLRATVRLLRRRRCDKPWARRLVVIGFDGQDPQLTERWMKEGKLPNMVKLAKQGDYQRLQTTYPSVSPVAWSSFSTGTHPAKHGIFDFLTRDRRSYLPLLSSTHIGPVSRFLRLGRIRIPLQRPELRLLRGSKPFWSILGDYLIWSTVLRVPITFPPDKFHGAQLSAMCTPDLLGSQGTFLLYTTRPPSQRFKEGGLRVALERNGHRMVTSLRGPENMFREGAPTLELPMTIDVAAAARRVTVTIAGQTVSLEPRKLSDWIPFAFSAIPGIKVSGICRMMVLEMDEHVSLYVSPLNIDPDHPAMPISHPSYYSMYLARRIGPYATLGLAEDTWALNEGVIDDATFLQQTYDIDAERRQMFLLSLDRLRRGTLTCVFDATDRIQHMFWRYLEGDHPAGQGRDSSPHRNAIEDLYKRNDEFVGEVLKRLGSDDVLMVLSDHGFTSFRRGCNLNAWLHQHGYLGLKPEANGSAEWLRDVDWSRTRAYALGLTGLFLNLKGREGEGIVEPGEGSSLLKKDLIQKLSGLRDEETGQVGINEVFDTRTLYHGPYLSDAPDLLVGYATGYRASWDGATGVVATPVFDDNVKAWSGDHCVDPRIVPGVLFCSHKVDRENPSLIDLAPTALRLFGIDKPAHMDGQSLFARDPIAGASGRGTAS